jgi:hypothetical protein
VIALAQSPFDPPKIGDFKVLESNQRCSGPHSIGSLLWRGTPNQLENAKNEFGLNV